MARREKKEVKMNKEYKDVIEAAAEKVLYFLLHDEEGKEIMPLPLHLEYNSLWVYREMESALEMYEYYNTPTSEIKDLMWEAIEDFINNELRSRGYKVDWHYDLKGGYSVDWPVWTADRS
jgi:hypothetical protein